MKPGAFTYLAPRSLPEALALLAEHAPDAAPLAGGQSLVQRMNMREIAPPVILDLNRVRALDYVKVSGNRTLSIGAMVRQQQLVDDEAIRSVCPALVAAANAVAFAAVRSRGTLGGSVANAEPGAQLPLMLTLLDAQVTLTSQQGSRTVPIAHVITGSRQTILARDELLVELTIPPSSTRARYAIGEFRRGHSGPPLVSVAVLLELDDRGTVASVRMGVSGATEIPQRFADEEHRLTGTPASADTFAEVAQQAASQVFSGDPVLADASLRQQATRALLERALNEATTRAQHATDNDNHRGQA